MSTMDSNITDLGHVYFHIGNGGTTFKVVDDGCGPKVVVSGSHFGIATHRAEICIDQARLALLGELFSQAAKYKRFTKGDPHLGKAERAEIFVSEDFLAKMSKPKTPRTYAKKPSGRARICTYVERHPNRTSTQIAKALKLRLDNVSSWLAKQVKAGLMYRQAAGPRGGYCYYY